MYLGKRIALILTAAGSGTRMGGNIPKQYLKVNGEMIIQKTLRTFDNHHLIDDIYLVVKREDMEFCRKELAVDGFLKLKAIVEGGPTRQASVYNGLRIIKQIPDYILIHDGVRPFVSEDEITKLIEAIEIFGAATLGVPVKDTVAKVEGGFIKENLDRNHLYSIQTPQGFLFGELLAAHKKAKKDGFDATDDGGLVKRAGAKVTIVKGSYDNIKITTREDLKYFESRLSIPDEKPKKEMGDTDFQVPDFRVGTGFDVHTFERGRKLILGGVDIPWEKGLEGHSDADVLVHTIIDSILGACGQGDIGRHFPDNDIAYKGVSSIKLLEKVNIFIRDAGFAVMNIDAVIIAEEPKIAPYIREMQSIIASALEIREDRINIKGTTTEGLGFCGRNEGIASMASSMVWKK